MNENINLCEILKDCPKGEKFYSPLLGNVAFAYISWDFDKVMVTCCDKEDDTTEYDIEFDGHIYIGSVKSVDIMLYPSKDQRDWSKWECPKVKKPKFDPKTLQPFDKVLGLMMSSTIWRLGFFSHKKDSEPYYNIVGGNIFHTILPFNSDTEYLVGTTDEAPDFYRYWED